MSVLLGEAFSVHEIAFRPLFIGDNYKHAHIKTEITRKLRIKLVNHIHVRRPLSKISRISEAMNVLK